MKQKDSLREFTRQAKIHVYTRPVDPDCYPAGLANSVHLSCMAENAQPVPFNKNYGILFAEGRIAPDNTIVPLGVRNPGIFRLPDGKIGICGERVLENGETDPSGSGKLLLWATRDLIHFESAGMVNRALSYRINNKEKQPR